MPNIINNQDHGYKSSSIMRKLKIRTRIVFVIVAGLTLHLTLMLGVFNIYAHTYLKNNLYNHIGNIQKEIGLSLELIVDDIQMLSLRLLVSTDIYRTIGDLSIPEEEKKAHIRSLMEGIVAKNELIGDIVVITNEGTRYRYVADTEIFEDPDDLLISNVKQSILPVVGKVKHDASGKAYVVFGQKYRNFYTGQNIGILLIYVKESSLFNLYKPAFEGIGYSYIASVNNEVISHPDKRIVGNTLLESDSFHPGDTAGYRNVSSDRLNYVLSTYPLSDRLNRFGVDWKLISVVSRPHLFGAIDEGNRNALFFALLTFIGLLVLSFYLAAKITEPVFNLTKKLGTIGKSGLKLMIDRKNPSDEISELENSYYAMIDRINNLINENNEEKEKQRVMELTALQSQINPHFLYNTLDAITWTARLKKQPEIERMISALATFFRISLHKGDKHIAVEEEIRLVQSFVTVELMRFPDKFDVTYDIPEPLRKIRILKLILQPLVENAIKHGMSEKQGKGLIEVKSWENEAYLFFEIKDDGVGFRSKSDVQNTGKNVLFQSGYGLRNVDERIKLEYGAECGLTITSEPGKGTTVLVRIRLNNGQIS
ncbi:sensor histidine kinase [Cohnella silvisoli]|uniref:Sensor histidine kinase n=1 Tax=Cohnella silvisoli TaxID=2873699 RepID=A0ABV1L348_9BACL|nr:sensor histidine kinase [Cohnella silvisoli]MCD9026098.1 sensor histidine kinase [Cohnella silvisoli]